MRPPTSPSKKSKAFKKLTADQQFQLVGGDEPQADASTDAAEPPSVTNADLDILARSLELARDSILAAECCIALLGADRLPKQVYSEELITACLGAIKNQLDRIVYPFVESSDNSALLLHVSRHEKAHRAQIAEVFQVLASVLPRINNLVCADTVTMSDSIIIQEVYIAIGPFFVTEAGASDSKGKKESFVMNTLGQTAMRGLRLEALSLIRSVSFIGVCRRCFHVPVFFLQIFAIHEEQRSWIIEEILSSLIKLSDTKQKAGQFRCGSQLFRWYTFLLLISDFGTEGRYVPSLRSFFNLFRLLRMACGSRQNDLRKRDSRRLPCGDRKVWRRHHRRSLRALFWMRRTTRYYSPLLNYKLFNG
jgi:cohesin loading factor subunit SCC2